MSVRIGAILSASSFRMRHGTSSGPPAFDGSISFSSFATPFSLMFSPANGGKLGPSRNVPAWWSSLVKTLENWSFRICALSLLSECSSPFRLSGDTPQLSWFHVSHYEYWMGFLLSGFLCRQLRFNIAQRAMTTRRGNAVRIIGFCEGNPPVTGKFPSQSNSNSPLRFWWGRHVVEETSDLKMVWDVTTLMWGHGNAVSGIYVLQDQDCNHVIL